MAKDLRVLRVALRAAVWKGTRSPHLVGILGVIAWAIAAIEVALLEIERQILQRSAFDSADRFACDDRRSQLGKISPDTAVPNTDMSPEAPRTLRALK